MRRMSVRGLLAGAALLLFGLWLCAFNSATPVKAQLMTTGAGRAGPASGGGGITYTFQSGGGNGSCGFGTSCSVSSVSIPAGFIVIGPTGNLATATQFSGVQVCGTPLTQATTASYGYDSEIWYGTTAGGASCTIQVSIASGGINYFYYGFGTLSGYSSSTPTTTCNGSTTNTGGSGTVSCGSALTVVSGGVAIGAAACQGPGSPTTLTNMTTDYSTDTGFGHSAAVGSLTPVGGTCAFSNASVAGATWH